MSLAFADTSYYLALVNADDEFHALATEITPELDGPMVTTAWVLAEVGNTLRRGHDRALAVRGHGQTPVTASKDRRTG